MTAVADRQPPVAPVVVAALLLAAGQPLRRLKLPGPTSKQIIEATGASRSRAYEILGALLALLPSLQRPVGRPPTPPPPSGPGLAELQSELSRAALRFLMDHPGCFTAGTSRHSYTQLYRDFALELRRQHPDIPLDRFAQAINVPFGTLKDWLSGTAPPEQREPATGSPDCNNDRAEPAASATGGPGGSDDGAEQADSTDGPGSRDDGAEQADSTDGPGSRDDGAEQADSTDGPGGSDDGAEQADSTDGPGGSDDGAKPADSTTAKSPGSTYIETVLAAFQSWAGTFGDFCEHVRRDWRVPFGRTIISNILRVEGLRIPKRRPGRCSSDEDALRGSFETFFPGAQWVGDGTAIDVVIDGEVFTFNLELVVDTFSGGFVGISVRDQEDSAAVVEAFDDGVSTTGAPPLALLLDNRESNHTQEVDAALGETLRMRSTLGRAQNKAHVEGAFGLFKQTAPPLVIDTSSPYWIARQLVWLQAETWGRTLNHRPRKCRGGCTRVELYQQQPSEEQVAKARAALEERCRKQKLAQQTLEARQDPVVRQLLDHAFERLSLIDPERHIRNAIACYHIDAIVDGIAIFEAKLKVGTLPEKTGGGYLLGIVRNLVQQNEGNAIAEALFRMRLEACDVMLAELVRSRDNARSDIADPVELIKHFADLAMNTQRRIDRLFWIKSIADVITAEPVQEHRALFLSAARRIHSAFKVSYRERHDTVRAIAAKVIPLD